MTRPAAVRSPAPAVWPARRLNLLLSQIPVNRWDFRGYIGPRMKSAATCRWDAFVGTDRLAARSDIRGRPGGRSRQSGRCGVGCRTLPRPGRSVRLSERRPSRNAGRPSVHHARPGNAITAGCTFTLDIRIGDFNYFNLPHDGRHDGLWATAASSILASTVRGPRTSGIAPRGTGAQILEGRLDRLATSQSAPALWSPRTWPTD